MVEPQDVLNSQLVKRLQSIRDYRSSRGKRYPLWVMLVITVLGVMSGAEGYKALEDFGIRHYGEVCQYLGISLKRLPSDTTLRRIEPQAGECVSMDGKSLNSTLTGHKESFQNFVGVVSVYSHQQRLVIAQAGYQNKLESKISVVQKLLETLALSGVSSSF